MGKQTFKFIASCMAIYLSLFLIELFVLKPLVDFVGNSFINNLIVYTIFTIVINPILTWFILKKFKFESEDVIKEEDGK